MFMFVGPVLLILATIFEWIMGNFFSMMVCSLFAVYWLSFGLLELPTLQLAAAYSKSGTNAAEGMATVQYNAALALYLVVWGIVLFTFFIFTLKTNMVFAGIFCLVTTGTWVLAGAYWKVASGDYVTAGHLQKVSLPQYRVLYNNMVLTYDSAGRRSNYLCRWALGMVHDVCNDGSRDASHLQASGGRFESPLASD